MNTHIASEMIWLHTNKCILAFYKYKQENNT